MHDMNGMLQENEVLLYNQDKTDDHIDIEHNPMLMNQ
jgi:hypothetical protein